MDYETVTTEGWSLNRRCGYRFYSEYWTDVLKWYCYTAADDGNYNSKNTVTDQRCNCPKKYGPYTCTNTKYTRVYTAVCLLNLWIDSDSFTNPSAAKWIKSNTCPKGWGPNYVNSNKGTNSYVSCAQGYVVISHREPIYGYVTRYRDVYYNYISSRVAKS